MSMTQERIANNLYLMLKHSRLTKKVIGERLCVSQPTVKKMFDQPYSFNINELMRLVECLGGTADDLFN